MNFLTVQICGIKVELFQCDYCQKKEEYMDFVIHKNLQIKTVCHNCKCKSSSIKIIEQPLEILKKLINAYPTI